MTQTVRVFRCNSDGTAEVFCVRESACSGDCHKCSGCGAVKQTMRFTARNPIGARAGDEVVVESRTGPVMAAAFVLYVLPLVLFFLGYALGSIWRKGTLMALLGFALGIAAAVLYDRLVAKKQDTVYTITGYPHSYGDAAKEGDTP